MGESRSKLNPAFPAAVLAMGVICISFGAIFARYADSPPLVKSAYRVGIAAALVVPFALVFYRHEYLRLSRREIFLNVLSGVFLAAHFASWITSLDYTSVASSVILVNTIPIWTAIFNLVFGVARPGRTMWFSVFLSVIGAAIVGYGDMSFDRSALYGDALAVAGGAAAAAYIICGREVRGKLGLVPYIALCYGTAAAILWAVVLVMGYPVTGFSAVTWGAFAGSALMSQLLGHSSYNWALGHFSSGFVSIMLLGEPIGSAILAYILFREIPTPVKFAGFALLMTAIVMAARDEGKR
ncbi:MAG: DMT family transporter [Synergistaceae bacterium]|jgi:drug/metabolite transporter (DMT)-like permease|nr:DMT family transporter [Synergistaceae bacterium]